METVIDLRKKPDGATHYAPAGDERAFRWFNMDKGQFGASWMYGRWDLFDRPSNRDDMVEIKVQWNGEGLPPVGTVCDFSTNFGRDMQQGCVLFADYNVILMSGYTLIELSNPGHGLRPIRTPKQIAADELQGGIDYVARVVAAFRGSHDPSEKDKSLASWLHTHRVSKQVAP